MRKLEIVTLTRVRGLECRSGIKHKLTVEEFKLEDRSVGQNPKAH